MSSGSDLSKVPLSILDLALVGGEESIAETYAGCVAMARRAEEVGYRRVWYAEHHGMPGIASAATSVLIAHVAAHTKTIRLGAGGIMLPNHSPLVIAEQFGTLETLHPGRIDLGVGRAPGGNSATYQALRRDPRASEHFPQDVVELQAHFGDEPPIPGMQAIPGRGTHVPIYILGSSLYGAQLAAVLGLPFAFASHFSPRDLHQAAHIYRERFQPSAQLERPHLMVSVNVVAADSAEEAQEQFETMRRTRIRNEPRRASTSPLTEEEAEAILHSPEGAYIRQMFTYTAIGTRQMVLSYLDDFHREVEADELITVHRAGRVAERIRSVELTGELIGIVGEGEGPLPMDSEERHPPSN